MTSTVKMILQFNGKQLTLPINPESITINRTAYNTDIDIIGLGKTTRKGQPGLDNLTIESFFPSQDSYFYTGVKPSTCIEFINEIWNTDNTNNNVAKIITTGLPINLNMYFVINSFNYDHKAGEEEDIYYTLDIKKYVPYGVKVIEQKTSGMNTSRTQSTTKKTTTTSTKNKSKTYKVVRGDCLWNITKKFTGNGARWKELYNINKKVIGSNPNLIYPNQILTLPSGW